MKIWLDGKLVEQEEAKTSVFDHGTLYGDGIFEGIRFYNKRVFRLEDHMDRLYNCSHYLLLDIPYTQTLFVRRSSRSIISTTSWPKWKLCARVRRKP